MSHWILLIKLQSKYSWQVKSKWDFQFSAKKIVHLPSFWSFYWSKTGRMCAWSSKASHELCFPSQSFKTNMRSLISMHINNTSIYTSFHSPTPLFCHFISLKNILTLPLAHQAHSPSKIISCTCSVLSFSELRVCFCISISLLCFWLTA